MDFDALAVRDGDRVTATGRVVRNETGDWFEPPLPVAEPGGMPRRVRAVWRGAVRVAGADFDQLGDRFERDGAVEGIAALTGIWPADQLRVVVASLTRMLPEIAAWAATLPSGILALEPWLSRA